MKFSSFVLASLMLVVATAAFAAEPEEGSPLQRVRDRRTAQGAADGALPRAAGVKVLDLEPGKTRFRDTFTGTAGLESAVQGYLAFARDPKRQEEKFVPVCAVTARLTERAGRFAPLAQVISAQLVEAVNKAVAAKRAGTTEDAHELMLDEALTTVFETVKVSIPMFRQNGFLEGKGPQELTVAIGEAMVAAEATLRLTDAQPAKVGGNN